MGNGKEILFFCWCEYLERQSFCWTDFLIALRNGLALTVTSLEWWNSVEWKFWRDLSKFCFTGEHWFFFPPSNLFFRRRQWHPTPVLLPGKSHGRRSLVGCSPWGREESDMIERLHFHFSLSCIGEGNGNLLQCSCLKKPRDEGAWWAAVYGVAQSWTRLKRLSERASK